MEYKDKYEMNRITVKSVNTTSSWTGSLIPSNFFFLSLLVSSLHGWMMGSVSFGSGSGSSLSSSSHSPRHHGRCCSRQPITGEQEGRRWHHRQIRANSSRGLGSSHRLQWISETPDGFKSWSESQIRWQEEEEEEWMNKDCFLLPVCQVSENEMQVKF